MPDVISRIGPFTFRSYTFLIGVAIIISIVWVMYHLRHDKRPGSVMDTSLAGLIGGLVFARGFHVLLNWVYFSDHTEEITRIKSGGLSWHGAVIGALLAMTLVARLRKVDYTALLGALAPVLPIMAFASWWGCGSAHCSYGAEVDNLSHYPSWLVWEAKDIYNLIFPRYRTQGLGMWLGVGLLLVVIVIVWRGWLQRHPDRRFWLMLALLSAGMFGLGFLRGDYAYRVMGSLRADQVLDVAFVAVSVGLLIWRSRSTPDAQT